ncbi:MAG: hypothetical protein H0T46_20705 [Deltaproteobacteria bacterium]|nr:hypothetical protein [Deltaproteobacteria bacterium]
MTTTATVAAELGRIASLGNLLGVNTARLLGRLTPLATYCGKDLVVTMSHGFDALSATTTVPRDTARTLCGPWLDALAGDQLSLQLDASSITAYSDEAALPDAAPEVVRQLGGELASLGYDGTTWTYVLEHSNSDDTLLAGTLARMDAVADKLGVTMPQRLIATKLHRSLSRGAPTRTSVRVKGNTVAPQLAISWDRVEWQPVGSMLGGFHPQQGAIGQLPRIARTCEVEEATVDLILGPSDPPAMRIAMRLA